MEAVNGIITGVVVTVISGLFWLAYNHNEHYRKVMPFLLIGILVGTVGIVGYNIAIANCIFRISELQVSSADKILRPTVQSLIFLPTEALGWILVFSGLYLWFLWKLPNILNTRSTVL